MTPEFARVVDPVFLHVLKLLERIEQGQTPEPDFERQKLHSLLSDMEAKAGSDDGQLGRRALVYWIASCVMVGRPYSGVRAVRHERRRDVVL
jgi:hypothetical protein